MKIFEEIYSAAVFLSFPALLIIMIFSLIRGRRLIRYADVKIKLKRRKSPIYFFISNLVSVILLGVGIMLKYNSKKYELTDIGIIGAFMIFLSLILIMILAVTGIFGRYAWLTPECIIIPATVFLKISDFEWNNDGCKLDVIRKKDRSHFSFIILDDVQEVIYMLEKNFRDDLSSK